MGYIVITFYIQIAILAIIYGVTPQFSQTNKYQTVGLYPINILLIMTIFPQRNSAMTWV
jgi:hypothetical protein